MRRTAAVVLSLVRATKARLIVTGAVFAGAITVGAGCRGQHLRVTYPDVRSNGAPCEENCKVQFYRSTRYKKLLEVTECRVVEPAESAQTDCDVVWDWVGN